MTLILDGHPLMKIEEAIMIGYTWINVYYIDSEVSKGFHGTKEQQNKKLDPLQHMEKETDEVPKFYALEYGDNNNNQKKFYKSTKLLIMPIKKEQINNWQKFQTVTMKLSIVHQNLRL